MERKFIIFIVGETSVGKDTIANLLPYKQIVSYTTRPKRENEVNGREHWFITDKEMDRIEKECELIAWTNNNGYRYCAIADDLEDEDVSIYVINPEGIRWFKENGSKNIDTLTIGITASLKDREERAKNRSDFNAEFYKRVAKEQRDFDRFKVENDFDYLIYNHDIVMTLNIVSYIVSEEVSEWMD